MTPKQLAKMGTLEEKTRKAIEEANYWRQRYEALQGRVNRNQEETQQALKQLLLGVLER